MDKEPARSVSVVLDILEQHQDGDTVQITVLRDGREQPVTVTPSA
jgi:S1-C subfamily serine protease